MGRKNKLQRFSDNLAFPNVYENFDKDSPYLLGEQGKQVQITEGWSQQVFGNEHPIVLELACGKGDYTLGLARQHRETNFIGVDIKGARIWKGAKKALEEELQNVCFLRTRIEWVERFFKLGEISEIWITFPDPFEKKSKANRRLTSPRFLEAYKKILVPGGPVHLKTDSEGLYAYTLSVLETQPGWKLEVQSEDIYSGRLPLDALEIKTDFERKHLKAGKTIKYLRWVSVPEKSTVPSD